MNRQSVLVGIIPIFVALASSGVSSAQDDAPEPIDFQRQVRPILSSKCFQCHGPDEEHREADLRLDTQAGLAGGILVPGDPESSELIARVTSEDSDLRMPPVDSGKDLTPEQIEILRQWIAEGAQWSGHWAFVPPERHPVPQLETHGEWVRHWIDAFVAEQWKPLGLTPGPEAPPDTLVRRLYLDLIGLPPTVEQADTFLQNSDPDRYTQLVETLLASPHYGEKWARHWLDAARYADSDGFEKDKPRDVWMYRNWVIAALNRDMPYDQFIIEQIAGDLLPDCTQDQRVATGFVRQSMLNEEGGIDPEQFRMEAMFDRMDAVGKAVLGVTIQCAQCHNHKYDPLTHTEYYRMLAFLNNSHEGSVPVYDEQQLAERERILGEISAIEQRLKEQTPDWRPQLEQWVAQQRGNQPCWTVLKLNNANDNSQRYLPQEDGSLLAQGYAPTRFDAQFTATSNLPEIHAIRLELLTDPNLPGGGPGRSLTGLCGLTEFKLEVSTGGDEKDKRSVEFKSVTADFGNDRRQLDPQYGDKDGKRGFTGPAPYAIDGDNATAWGIDTGPGRRGASHRAVFLAQENVAMGPTTHLRFHLVQMHGGWNSDDNQTMNLGRFRISVSSQVDAVADPLPQQVRAMVESRRSVNELTEQQCDALFSYWRTTQSQWQAANKQIEALWSQHPEGTTQLVLCERAHRRPTHLLGRGDFLKPQEEVEPGVAEFLHPLEVAGAPTRLDFARWLVDRRSPTTARAMVNRVWQAYFGRGLVETSEDLGSQGSPPSHPALLDTLAVEFMQQGWSLKWLHRQIVMSATYRQSSQVTASQLERDPVNRSLARGPRFRIDAELVRDVALSASGLLTDTIGGPSVYPPAPEFLFQPPASYGPKTWDSDLGADKYRRGLYTFRFRSIPYPAFSVFDAPSGTSACTRRSRSNTPLQALTTLNEPLYVECARALANAALDRPDSTSDAQRVTFAFRCCVTRPPTPSEQATLLELLEECRERFAQPQNGELAQQLAALDPHAENARTARNPAELAAWTAVCRVMLNLDETITKE